MATPRRRPFLALPLVLAATLALSSCGGGDGAELLPGRTASEISSNLKEVRRLAGEGECVGAQDAALAVSDQVDALGGVDKRLKAALREGADRLYEVVAACQEAEPEEEEETSPGLSTEAEVVEDEGEKRKPKQEGKQPPGQEKKAEKEAAAPADEETEKTSPTNPTTTPAETPTETPGSGTPPGGIAPGTEAGGEG